MSADDETTSKAETATTSGDEPVKEEESTATFEPVVKLEEVEVQSGEEQEVSESKKLDGSDMIECAILLTVRTFNRLLC